MWSLLCSQGFGLSTTSVQKYNSAACLMLGFVFDIKVKSNAQNVAGKFASKEYHAVLTAIILDIGVVHSAGQFQYTLCLNCNFFDLKMQCPIAVIIRMPRGTILTVHITTHQLQSIFTMSVMYCLRIQITHMLCVIVSLSRKVNTCLSREIGKERNGMPLLSLH